MKGRDELLSRLGERLQHRDRSRPFRLGIDGRSGSGKSTLGHELAEALVAAGEPVLRLDSDAFHHLSAIRHQRSDEPARGYYEEAYDLTTLADHVLVPLGEGRRAVRSALCDFFADEPIHTTEHVDQDAVVIFECTFIQREELRDLWDLVLFLEVSPDLALERAARRDAAAMGSEDAATRTHVMRYGPAWDIYETEQDPRDHADVVIDHDDPQRPAILRW